MTVISLLPALEQGGVESVVVNLNRAVTDGGWHSVVISKGGRLVEQIVHDGGRHIELDLKSKNPLTYCFRVLSLAKAILRILDEAGDDQIVVTVHSRVPAWLYVGARKLSRRVRDLPWVTYAHGANSVSKYSSVMTYGDRIVVPSKFLGDFLKTNYSVADEKLCIVTPPVDGKRFDPDNLDSSFIARKRREWGIRDGERVLMAVGRITPVKGLRELIQDFTSDKYDEDVLVIVGGADRHHLEYLEELKSLALNSRKRIVFAGAQSNVPECLAIANTVISANTTKPESFGLSVAEAYAMNKLVIAKRFGGVGEIMDAVERIMMSESCNFRRAILVFCGYEKFSEHTLSVLNLTVKAKNDIIRA